MSKNFKVVSEPEKETTASDETKKASWLSKILIYPIALFLFLVFGSYALFNVIPTIMKICLNNFSDNLNELLTMYPSFCLISFFIAYAAFKLYIYLIKVIDGFLSKHLQWSHKKKDSTKSSDGLCLPKKGAKV